MGCDTSESPIGGSFSSRRLKNNRETNTLDRTFVNVVEIPRVNSDPYKSERILDSVVRLMNPKYMTPSRINM